MGTEKNGWPWDAADSHDASALMKRGKDLLAEELRDIEAWHGQLDQWHADIFAALRDSLISYTEAQALATVACLIEDEEPERWYA